MRPKSIYLCISTLQPPNWSIFISFKLNLFQFVCRRGPFVCSDLFTKITEFVPTHEDDDHHHRDNKDTKLRKYLEITANGAIYSTLLSLLLLLLCCLAGFVPVGSGQPRAGPFVCFAGPARGRPAS